ncbi:hypothetical protein H4582DRAFT_2055955 [Lactarius indigo]|nr:hypothetical protein H4582DRAFT_2055955 [Lactarius indigo]
MPPRARRIRPSGPGPAMGPTLPPPAPPPVMQQHPFMPPPPSFQHLHAGAYPVPGGNGQYHTAGLDRNMPVYAQLYGAQPYGMQPYGAPLAYPQAPFPPHFASYPGAGNAQLQPWGYGHYPHDQLPNIVPYPVATRPDEWAEGQSRAAIAPSVGVAERDGRTVTDTRKDSNKTKIGSARLASWLSWAEPGSIRNDQIRQGSPGSVCWGSQKKSG